MALRAHIPAALLSAAGERPIRPTAAARPAIDLVSGPPWSGGPASGWPSGDPGSGPAGGTGPGPGWSGGSGGPGQPGGGPPFPQSPGWSGGPGPAGDSGGPGWSGGPAGGGRGPGPAGTPPEPPEPGRRAVAAGLALVALLTGAALFAAGFSIGLRQGGPAADAGLAPVVAAWDAITGEYVGEVDEATLAAAAVEALFDALGDRYSGFMPADDYDSSLDDISGQFEGIGARMLAQTPDGVECEVLGDDCFLVVEEVIAGAPAERDGLRNGDRFLAVDGTPVAGATIDDVIGRVRGPRDTPVTIEIERDGDRLELTIVRGVIASDDVTTRTLADGTVGYLRIDGFTGSAEEDFRTSLRTLLDEGVTGLILDVRDDPGGYVDAAAGIASELIARGPILWEEDASGRQVSTDATGEGIATDPAIRVVVLVNGGTASASEILAAALGENGRATIVGEQTFGKGTIQQWRELPGAVGGYRLSVAKWLTPKKRWIHDTGLTPDVVIGDPSPGAGDDPQLDRALELLASPRASTPPAPSATPAPSIAPASPTS